MRDRSLEAGKLQTKMSTWMGSHLCNLLCCTLKAKPIDDLVHCKVHSARGGFTKPLKTTKISLIIGSLITDRAISNDALDRQGGRDYILQQDADRQNLTILTEASNSFLATRHKNQV